ncbi:MAG TPA: hypothetical protein VMN81_03420 [Vicinamibacterales bacterium]|nr:hypothetical protein [Vicinamibacterales bacterium]
MAGPRPTHLKRQRERALVERRNEKAAKREAQKAQKATVPPPAPGEDPDLAGIKPGPQPRIYELDEEPEEEGSTPS